MGLKTAFRAFICVVAGLSFLGCGAGAPSLGGGGSASVVIGPGGGSVTTPDGMLKVTVPGGALPADMTITVKSLTMAELSPTVAADMPDMAFSLEPDGLVFMAPVELSVDLGAPDINQVGLAKTSLSTAILDSQGNVTLLANQTITLDVKNNKVMLKGETTHFSQLAVKSTVPGQDTDLSLLYPSNIPDGGSAAVNVIIDQSLASNLSSAAPPTFDALFTGPLNSVAGPLMNRTFTPGGNLNAGQAQQFVATFVVDCTTSGTGVIDVTTNIPALALGNIFPNALPGGSSAMAKIEVLSGDIICDPPVTGGQNQFFSFLGLVDNIESVTPIPLLKVGATVGEPLLLSCAGGGVVIDGMTGALIQDWRMTGNTSAHLQSLTLIPSSGQGPPCFLQCGQGMAITQITPAGTLGQIDFSDGNVHLDCSRDGGNSVHTAHVTSIGSIDKVDFNVSSGQWELNPTGINGQHLPLNTFSVQANFNGDRFLVVGDNELRFIDTSGTTITSSIIFNQGMDMRRVRWDPNSGIGAASDFMANVLRIFTWDGINPPVMTDTVAVGDGPLGVDLQNNFIVSTGFNDDTLSIVDVDAMGLVQSVQTNPLPFPGGQNPEHAAFNDDPMDSITITFLGDSSVGILRNAFPGSGF